MKKIGLVIGTFATLICSAVTAQDQLEPLSNRDFQRITQAVQSCFSDAGTESDARICLDIPSQILDQILDCYNVGSQFHMTICSGELAKALDAVLNAEYKISIEYMISWDANEFVTEIWDPVEEAMVAFSYEEILRSAQRAWLEYRDADCLARIGPNTGYTSYSMQMSYCISSMHTERIMVLILIRKSGYKIGEYHPDDFNYDDYM